jgi:hypothetical protein
LAVVGWHRKRILEGKRGVDSWYFITSALILAFFATGVACFAIGLRSHATATAFQKWPDPYVPVQVLNQTFENKEVLLDGHSYTRCKFANVTFVYNGTTPIQFTNNQIQGTIRHRSDNQAVEGTIVLMKGFDLLKDGVPLNFSNSSNVVETPTTVK